MYARTIEGKEYTFDFGTGLVEDNLLIVDRETRSVWSQLAGTAVSGPMRHTPLPSLPSLQTTWGYWRALHPDTRVSIREGMEGRPYTYQVFTPGEPRERGTQVEHDVSTLGLGIVIGEDEWFFPLAELGRVDGPLQREMGGASITIHHADDGVTAWAEDAAGEMLVTVMVYEPRWLAFYPESRIFRAEV